MSEKKTPKHGSYNFTLRLFGGIVSYMFITVVKKSLPSFSVGPFQVLEGCYKVPSEPSFLQTEEHQLSQTVTGKPDVLCCHQLS